MNADEQQSGDGHERDAQQAEPSRADGPPEAPRNLTPAAQRALAEADERRRQQSQNETKREREVGGRKGPDPVRYGDWEKGGIASDF